MEELDISPPVHERRAGDQTYQWWAGGGGKKVILKC